ncbi:MAG: hypothetical protein OSA99_02515 [Acidimicrobiales bacterium]|nr:hypothetical protein [Acidimicrobiales bacterium]
MRTTNTPIKLVALVVAAFCLALAVGAAAGALIGEEDASPSASTAAVDDAAPPVDPVVADVVAPAYSGPPLSPDDLVALFPDVAPSADSGQGTGAENLRLGERRLVPTADAAPLLAGAPLDPAETAPGPDGNPPQTADTTATSEPTVLADPAAELLARIERLGDAPVLTIDDGGDADSPGFTDECATRPADEAAADAPAEPTPAPTPDESESPAVDLASRLCTGVPGTVILDEGEDDASIAVHGVDLAIERSEVCPVDGIDDEHYGVVVFTGQPVAVSGLATPIGIDGADLTEPISFEMRTADDQELLPIDRTDLPGASDTGVVAAYPTCAVVGPIPVEAVEVAVRLGLAADGAEVRGVAETLRLPVARGAQTLELIPIGFFDALRNHLDGERRVTVVPDSAGDLRVQADLNADEFVSSVLWARDPARPDESRCGTRRGPDDSGEVEGRPVPGGAAIRGFRIDGFDRTERMTLSGAAFEPGTEADVCIEIRNDATPPRIIATYAVPVTTASPVRRSVQLRALLGEDPDLEPAMMGVVVTTPDGGCGDVYRVDEVREQLAEENRFVPVCDIGSRGREQTLSVFSSGSEQRAPAHTQTVILDEQDCPCWNSVLADVPGTSPDEPFAEVLVTVVRDGLDEGPPWRIGTVEERDDLPDPDGPGLRLRDVSVTTTGPEPWLDVTETPDTRASATMTYRTDAPADVEVIAQFVPHFASPEPCVGTAAQIRLSGVPDDDDPTSGSATFGALCADSEYHFAVRVADPESGAARIYSHDPVVGDEDAQRFHLLPRQGIVETGELEIPLDLDFDTTNLWRGVIAQDIYLRMGSNPRALSFHQHIGHVIRAGVTCASGNDFYDDQESGTFGFGAQIEFDAAFDAYFWVSGNPFIDCPAPTDSLSVYDAVHTLVLSQDTRTLDDFVAALAAGPVQIPLLYPLDRRNLTEERRTFAVITIEHADRTPAP